MWQDQFTSLFSHSESFTDETCNTKEKKENKQINNQYMHIELITFSAMTLIHPIPLTEHRRSSPAQRKENCYGVNYTLR